MVLQQLVDQTPLPIIIISIIISMDIIISIIIFLRSRAGAGGGAAAAGGPDAAADPAHADGAPLPPPQVLDVLIAYHGHQQCDI